MFKHKPITEVGICPVCNGTKRQDAGDNRWVASCAGYDKPSHTIPCQNCGGQYMFGSPTGLVKHNTQGTPCKHEYQAVPSMAKACLHVSHCDLCGDTYEIDSGD